MTYVVYYKQCCAYIKKCQFCFYDCVFKLMCVNLDELPVLSVCCIIYNNHIF